MLRPRFMVRLVAWAVGYFWLPCPICNEPFAGFEWGETIITGSGGRGVCSKPECCAEARRRSDRTFTCVSQ
jgi:hypothetical protein